MFVWKRRPSSQQNSTAQQYKTIMTHSIGEESNTKNPKHEKSSDYILDIYNSTEDSINSISNRACIA